MASNIFNREFVLILGGRKSGILLYLMSRQNPYLSNMAGSWNIIGLVTLVLVDRTGCTVIDLTHVYGDDVLYPPVGPGGTSDMYNFTVMQRGWSDLTKSW